MTKDINAIKIYGMICTYSKKGLKALFDESIRVVLNPPPKDGKKAKKSVGGRRGCFIM